MKEINITNLWILVGVTWIIPQVINEYFSEFLWTRWVILSILGILTIFTDLPNKFLLKDEKKKED